MTGVLAHDIKIQHKNIAKFETQPKKFYALFFKIPRTSSARRKNCVDLTWNSTLRKQNFHYQLQLRSRGISLIFSECAHASMCLGQISFCDHESCNFHPGGRPQRCNCLADQFQPKPIVRKKTVCLVVLVLLLAEWQARYSEKRAGQSRSV